MKVENKQINYKGYLPIIRPLCAEAIATIIHIQTETIVVVYAFTFAFILLQICYAKN